MCIGRSMNFDPSRSARALSEGPRSMVTTDTRNAATIIARTAMVKRTRR
jgi:hypothetical protein